MRDGAHRPRVLHLVGSFDQGGSERQALQLVRLLRDSGRYEVHLACGQPDGVLRPEAEALGLGPIPAFPLTSFYDWNALVQYRRFARWVAAKRIEIVHTHDFYTNVFGIPGAMLGGVPVRIASQRETAGWRTALQSRVQRLAYGLAHAIVVNAEAVGADVIQQGVRPEKVTTIYNGIDRSRVAAAQDGFLSRWGIAPGGGARVVTIVANMRHPVKDHETFLLAAQRVHEAVPDARFALAGEGELQECIRQRAAQLGLAGVTYFLGRCEDVGGLLAASDVCVLSSRAEGFANAILEYMAAGKAVVATDVGGAREAVVEGETGYLVKAGDAASMADRIVRLLRDAGCARAMGERGKRRIEEHFSCAAQLERTTGLYEKLLDRRGRE